MIGWCVPRQCLVACLFLELSQQPTCPHVRHSRRCAHSSPIFRHSSHPFELGFTFRISLTCWQVSLIAESPTTYGRARVVKQSSGRSHSPKYCNAMPKATPRKLALRIRRLSRAELPIDTVELARYLIGKTVVRDLMSGRHAERPAERMAGRIVETEAYPVGDAAGHAFPGLRSANRSLFLRRGHAYVRFTYGSCWIFNVTSEIDGVGAGVLIRALEPLQGIAEMMRHRGV